MHARAMKNAMCTAFPPRPTHTQVDFKEVTKRKAAIISREAALRALLPGLLQGGAGGPAGTTPVIPSSPALSTLHSSPAPPPACLDSSSSSSASAAVQPEAAAAAAAAAVAGGGAAAPPVLLSVEAGEVLAPLYSLVPVDLRNTGALEEAVRRAGFDRRCGWGGGSSRGGRGMDGCGGRAGGCASTAGAGGAEVGARGVRVGGGNGRCACVCVYGGG